MPAAEICACCASLVLLQDGRDLCARPIARFMVRPFRGAGSRRRWGKNPVGGHTTPLEKNRFQKPATVTCLTAFSTSRVPERFGFMRDGRFDQVGPDPFNQFRVEMALCGTVPDICNDLRHAVGRSGGPVLARFQDDGAIDVAGAFGQQIQKRTVYPVDLSAQVGNSLAMFGGKDHGAGLWSGGATANRRRKLHWAALARYAEAGSAPATGAQIVTQSALINLLNPKLTLFFVSFLPQFVPQTHPAPMLTMGLMGLVLVAQAFVVFLDYGELAARGGDLLRRRPRIMVPFQTGIAVLFAGLGLRVILGGR